MDNKNPKVSVVIPCYNQGQYVDEAVKSVLDQTYQDFEIIIVDDGSTDEFTNDLLKNYNKPKTRVIHTDNQGLASARNNGIKEAKGEYILPLDVDDKIGKEYLEMAAKILDENPDIGIVYCEAVHFGLKDDPFRLPEYSLKQMLGSNILFCSSVFRKKQWEQVGGFNINLVYGLEDWDFWLSLIELGLKVYRIPKVLFYYRIKEDSMINSMLMSEDQLFFMRLHTVLNHKQLYQNIAEVKILIKVAELYIDTGYGFNVKQVLSQTILGKEKKLEFDLSHFSGIKSIRFDPINDYCVLHIDNIIIVREDNSSYELSNYHSNAVNQENNDFIFTTNDPNIFLNIFNEKIRKVIINLEYIAIGKDTLGYFGKAHANILKEQNLQIYKQVKEIHAKEVEIHRFKGIINSLQSQVDAKTLAYEDLLKSRSWKMMALFRWLNHKVKTILYYCLYNRQYKTIKESGLFDIEYYLKQRYDVYQTNLNPLLHYVRFGFKEGIDPNPLFDSAYYIEHNPDVAESGTNPLAHYIEVGAGEGKNPHPLFDSVYYSKHNPDVAESGTNPLAHYIEVGAGEGKNPHPLFDSAYYLEHNPDVAESGMNPLLHYIESGAREGRNPHPLFDSVYYSKHNPDVAESGMNPLVHFIEVGISEGRNPNPQIDGFRYKPTISIITPVYNVDEQCLHKTIRSVLNQIYNDWELCLVDDGSTQAHIKPILERYAKKNHRIKVKFLNKNKGIAVASNEGVSLATGEFIGFLDHDDILTMDALFEVVKVINNNNADIIYSDEDIIDEGGRHVDAIFKPDFSPDLLFSHNYITHLLIVKKSLFHEVGGFSSKYEGAQDYDLILKLTEKTKKIFHIPKLLYQWRSVYTSTSANPEVKSYADDAGKMALKAALDRQKIKGSVLKANQRFFYRVKRNIFSHPFISIIIPFKDEPDYLKSCIQAILYKTKYQNFEIIGINNNSKRSETFSVMNNFLEVDKRIKFYDYDIPFNYSKINNYAVGLANGEHIVLMNSDIEIINFDWLESLLEHSQREDVGAVGAKLYYSNNTIQHAGVIIGISGFAGHSHRCFPRQAQGYYNRLMCIQNISAVSGALLMVKKRLYEEIGGLDEMNLSIALNDVDFCLRLRDRGYLNIFTPYCEAIHYESTSRGYEEIPERKVRFLKEIKYFQKKWKDLLDSGDPYYNPNLTLSKEDFSLRENGFYTSEC